MDSDSNEEKYYASEDMEDNEPCPTSTIVVDYNCHMGHIDIVDRMANSYTASRRTW